MESTCDSKLPPAILEYSKQVIELQDLLLNVTLDNVEHTCESILTLPFKNTSDGVKSITDNIIKTLQFRDNLLIPLADLTIMIYSKRSENNFLNTMKEHMTGIAPLPVPPIWLYPLLKKLYDQEFFNNEEIMMFMQKKYVDLYPYLNTQGYLSSCWFFPSIQKYDYEHSKKIIEKLTNERKAKRLPKIFCDFLDQFDDLSADDWKLHSFRCINKYKEGTIEYILKNDDLEHFIELSSIEDFDFNQRILASVFEYSIMLNHEPTLIQFSAFYGSEKCYFYLVEKNVDLNMIDSAGRTLLQFAVSGGNLNIIQKCYDMKLDFHSCLQYSTFFCQHEVFNWLFQNVDQSLMKINGIIPSVVHFAASQNNVRVLMFCFDHNVDVNCPDIVEATPTYDAAQYGNIEALKILISHKDVDVNKGDKSGETPLHTASYNDHHYAISVLLTSPSIDINIGDVYGVLLNLIVPLLYMQLYMNSFRQ